MRNESFASDSLFISGNTFQQGLSKCTTHFPSYLDAGMKIQILEEKPLFEVVLFKNRLPFRSDQGMCGKKRDGVLEIDALFVA